MVVFWDPVIKPLLEAVSPGVVVEVGVAQGATTVKLLDFASSRDCVVHSIDPMPGAKLDLAALEERYGAQFVFHRRPSLEVLPEIGEMDVVLLDGDHNWYTVYNELRLLAACAADEGRSLPLILAHDIDWPYDRRDLYYRPEAIPAEFRHRYRRAGVVPGKSDLSDTRGLNAGMCHAVVAGTPRNGVRTAIEDFLAEAGDEIKFRSVPGLHGIGILALRARIDANAELRHRLEELESPVWLENQARLIELYRLSTMVQLDQARRKGRPSERSGDKPARSKKSRRHARARPRRTS